MASSEIGWRRIGGEVDDGSDKLSRLDFVGEISRAIRTKKETGAAAMFSGQYHTRRDGSDSGKFAHVPFVGVQRAEQHGYKKHQYEISSRKIGLTVKRTTYSVSIQGEFGERLTFLADLPSEQAAKKEAEAWIDRDIRRRKLLHRPLRPKHLPQ